MDFKLFVLALFITYTTKVNSFNISEYRLPNWATPAHYYLNVDLRWPDEETFRGYTWIDLNVTEANHSELVLNVDPDYIDVDNSTIVVDYGGYICSEKTYSNKTEILNLNCKYDMHDTERYTQFQMHYTVKYSDTADGLHKYHFTINGTKKYIIFSHFEPKGFRKVFPSYDEPKFKAPIRLSVDHFSNLTVVTNTGKNQDTQNLFGSSTFEDTPPMSTYLVAIVAGNSKDWSHLIIPSLNYKLTIKTFSQAIFEEYLSLTSEVAPKLLNLMGEWTGINYKDLGIDKLTLAALPGMGGAMENWGLITFGQKYLIDEGKRTTGKQILESISVMSHEISHQWFGNYITTNWWSETWLNEGFASYFEWYLADMLNKYYNFSEMFVIKELQLALKGDGPKALPLSQRDASVNSPEDIKAAFSVGVAYNKGGSIVRMLKYVLGEEVFRKGIQNYIKANALGSVTSTKLLEHLQKVLNDSGKKDVDLVTYMDSWIHEPGYPVVTTSIGELNDKYLVSIDIYKFSPSLNETDDREKSVWWVPINYITSDQTDVSAAEYFWINPGRTFGLYIDKTDDSWCIINAGATGLYRVDYDQNIFSRILKVLSNPDTMALIPTVNRAQLIDDQFNIAKYYTKKMELNDHRPYENAFKLAQYLKNENEYLPWYTFLKEVEYLLNEIEDNSTKQALENDVLSLVKTKFVVPDQNKTDLSNVLLKNLLLDWACRLGHNEAIAYVKTQYASFLKDPKSVDADYRDVIVCRGIQNSKEQADDYLTLLKLYSQTILPHEQYDMIVGAGCMIDADAINSFLETTLKEDPIVNKEHWKNMFDAVYSNSPEGLDTAIHFLVNHLDEIEKKWVGATTIESMFSSIGSRIVKSEHIKLLQDLLIENSLDPNIIKAVNTALKNAENNVEWIHEHGIELKSILVYNGEDVPTTTTTEAPTTQSTGAADTNIYSVSLVLSVLLLFFM